MRFLSTVWNFPGCVHPFFAVAKELAARGHEVGFYTGANYRDTVQSQGWRFFPFSQVLERTVDEKVFSSNSIGANWHRPWSVPVLLKEFFVDSIPYQINDLGPILDEWSPDVILSDPALFAPMLILHETRKIPVALLSYVLGCMIPGPEIPPVGLGLHLPRNPLQKAWNSAIGVATDLRLSNFRGEANRYRAIYGLAPVRGSVVNLAANLPLYLVTSCRELDYPRTSLPRNVQYVGGCFWYPDLPAPEWVRSLPADPPVVYVNEGTIHVAEPYILRAAVRGLADVPARIVLTTGLHRNLATLNLGALPANVIAESWVNHNALMPKVSAMVCTGGPGTVLSALYSGVPMVVIPTEWDHPENAARLVHAGAAIRLQPRQCTARRLRDAVLHLLHEPSYRRNALRIRDALKRCGGVVEAATRLESVTQGGPV